MVSGDANVRRSVGEGEGSTGTTPPAEEGRVSLEGGGEGRGGLCHACEVNC